MKTHIMMIAVALVLVLGGCSSTENESTELENQPVEQLYNQATAALEGKNYEEAAQYFDEVERQHPYSVWATRAKLMSAYAMYEAEDYDRAVFALDRFIQMHPGNERVDYAYYLKGLCYYEQISDIRRDQKMTELAMKHLDEVVKKFPNSDYARDAKFKIDLTLDHLAGQEMEIGRFYMREHKYHAAINRFTTVVKKYETTTHVAEALYRLVEAYIALGLPEEAQKNAAVLGHNYPGSEWYQDAYSLVTGDDTYQSSPDGFFGRAWHSITN